MAREPGPAAALRESLSRCAPAGGWTAALRSKLVAGERSCASPARVTGVEGREPRFAEVGSAPAAPLSWPTGNARLQTRPSAGTRVDRLDTTRVGPDSVATCCVATIPVETGGVAAATEGGPVATGDVSVGAVVTEGVRVTGGAVAGEGVVVGASAGDVVAAVVVAGGDFPAPEGTDATAATDAWSRARIDASAGLVAEGWAVGLASGGCVGGGPGTVAVDPPDVLLGTVAEGSVGVLAELGVEGGTAVGVDVVTDAFGSIPTRPRADGTARAPALDADAVAEAGVPATAPLARTHNAAALRPAE